MDEVVAESSMLRLRHQQAAETTSHLDDIPPLTRSLTQVHADSTRLLSARVASTSVQTATHAVKPAALRLFARVGFDADRLHRAISSVESAATFVDIPLRPTGTHSHLVTVAPRALDESRLQTNAALREYARGVVQEDLVQANKRVLGKLRELMEPDFSRGEAVTPLAAKKMQKTDRDGLALAVDERYVEAVRGIALHGDGHSAPFLMHETAMEIPDIPHFVESLAIVASVARHSRGTPEQDLVVWGARVVLEDSFAEQIPGLPTKPRQATTTAVVPAVSEYIRGLQHRGMIPGSDRRARDVPLWPRVYYCLRIGHVKAALQILRMEKERFSAAGTLLEFVEMFLNGKKEADRNIRRARASIDEVAPCRMEDGGSRNLEEGMPGSPGCIENEGDLERLEALYKEMAWNSNDPYLRVCFVLLMRLELLVVYDSLADMRGVVPASNGHTSYPSFVEGQKCSLDLPDTDMSLLFGSVEDYLWLRLWLCRTPMESNKLSEMSKFSFVKLRDIQENMVSCGNAHFDPDNTKLLLYPFVLVCCGLYEEAVSYLTTHSHDHLVHSGIHLGIVLYHLRWIKDDEAFHAVIARYVSLFSRVFPTEAAIYLLSIRDKRTVSKLLQELVVTSEEYTALLGTGDEEDGESGTLAGLLSEASAPLPSLFSREDLSIVRNDTALHGAREAASKGDFATASSLYKTAGRIPESVEMNMRTLAEVVDKQSSSRRAVAIANAQVSVSGMRNESIRNVSETVARTLELLLRTAEVFQNFWTGRFHHAWQALRSLDILSITAQDESTCQRAFHTFSERYHPCVHRCSQELLKVALHIAEYALKVKCVLKYPRDTQAAEENHPMISDGEPRLPLAEEIKSLCMVVGLAKFTEPWVSERLVQVEVLLSNM
eukprot:GFKZ01015314.1.p2 GENE.GFKZ01015314.1~~GFKZ01015314.1.p2  ORF type:complete len:889 (-),score=112.46 GFKZ01015314.1:3296-5962(-)